MATMNVSLPDAMKAWVEDQAETGRYSNASDYVRDLIRRDKARVEAERLALLRAELTAAFAAPDSAYRTLDADTVIARNART